LCCRSCNRLSDKSIKKGRVREGRPPIRALILTPTRGTSAAQVEESVRVYGKHVKLTSMVDVSAA